MAKTESKGVTLKKSHLIAAVIVVLALVAGGIFLGLNWQDWFGNKPDTAQANVQGDIQPDIDPNAKDYENSDPKDEGGAAEGIAIPGYPSIRLPANARDVQVAFLNPAGNPCYFTFELALKESGESLYTSKLVPPGKVVTDITLSRALKPGEYNATIKISTSSLEDQSPMNGANVETVLIVK